MKAQDIFAMIQSALDTAKKTAKEHKLMDARMVSEDMLDMFIEYMEDRGYVYCCGCELWFKGVDDEAPGYEEKYCKRCQKERRESAIDIAIVKRDFENRG